MDWRIVLFLYLSVGISVLSFAGHLFLSVIPDYCDHERHDTLGLPGCGLPSASPPSIDECFVFRRYILAQRLFSTRYTQHGEVFRARVIERYQACRKASRSLAERAQHAAWLLVQIVFAPYYSVIDSQCQLGERERLQWMSAELEYCESTIDGATSPAEVGWKITVSVPEGWTVDE